MANNNISVIIPTYKEPEVLDLCLQSIIEGQVNNNQILVIVDGFYEINKEVLNKYSNQIETLILEENVGMIRSTNLGVYNASNNLILVINDDNILPKNWDINLLKHWQDGRKVLTPNQIEPRPSMFKQFHIKDLGTNPSTFNLKQFQEYENNISSNTDDYSGSTFPFMMSKIDYLRIGGMDESYPGPWVVDWEFFMKCQMNGLHMIRTYNTHFYHFGSLATTSPEKQHIEQQCYEYAIYKWGTNIKHNPQNNMKYL